MEDLNIDTSHSEIDLYNEQALLRYDFALEALLGCGGFGRVYRCRCLKSGAVVAIKVLSKADARRQGMQARVVSEVAVHSSLSHNNVAKLLDFFEDARRVFLVLDCASGGDVFRLVSKLGRLSLGAARHFTRQLLCALKYLHDDANVMHRDLKLSNLLLYENENIDMINEEKEDDDEDIDEKEEVDNAVIEEIVKNCSLHKSTLSNDYTSKSSNMKHPRSWYRRFTLRLCDFGLAVKTLKSIQPSSLQPNLSESKEFSQPLSNSRQEQVLFHEHRTVCGTPAYIAPEIIALVSNSSSAEEGEAGHGRTGARGYGTGVDVFSAGCLLYCMCFGQPPTIVISPPSSSSSSSLPERGHIEIAIESVGMQVIQGVQGVHSVLSPDFESNLSTLPIEAADTIRLLLRNDASSRPTASQALKLPFFTLKNLKRVKSISEINVTSVTQTPVEDQKGLIDLVSTRKNSKKIFTSSLNVKATTTSITIMNQNQTNMVKVSPIRTTKIHTSNLDTQTLSDLRATKTADDLVISTAHVSARTTAAAAMEILTQETLAHESVSQVLRDGNSSPQLDSRRQVTDLNIASDGAPFIIRSPLEDYYNARVSTTRSSPLSSPHSPHSPPCLIRKTAEDDAVNFFGISRRYMSEQNNASPHRNSDKMHVPRTPPPLIRAMSTKVSSNRHRSNEDDFATIPESIHNRPLKQTPPNVSCSHDMPTLPLRRTFHTSNKIIRDGRIGHQGERNDSKMPLFASHSSVWTPKARAPSRVETVSAPVSAYVQATVTNTGPIFMQIASTLTPSNSLLPPPPPPPSSHYPNPSPTLSINEERDEGIVKGIYPSRSRAFNSPSSPSAAISSARELALPSPLPTPTTASIRSKFNHINSTSNSTILLSEEDEEKRKVAKAALIAKLNEKSIHVPSIILPHTWNEETEKSCELTSKQNTTEDKQEAIEPLLQASESVQHTLDRDVKMNETIEEVNSSLTNQNTFMTDNNVNNTTIPVLSIEKSQGLSSTSFTMTATESTENIDKTDKTPSINSSAVVPSISTSLLINNPFAWAQKEFDLLQRKQKEEREAAEKSAAINAASEKAQRESARKLLERIRSRDDAGASAVLSALGLPRTNLRGSSSTSHNNTNSTKTILSLSQSRDTPSVAMTSSDSKYSGNGTSATTLTLRSSIGVEGVTRLVNTGLRTSLTCSNSGSGSGTSSTSDTMCSMNGGGIVNASKDLKVLNLNNSFDIDDSRSSISESSYKNNGEKTYLYSRKQNPNETATSSSSLDIGEADISHMSTTLSVILPESQPETNAAKVTENASSTTFSLLSFSSTSSLFFFNTMRLKPTTVRCRSSQANNSQEGPLIMQIQKNGDVLLTTANKLVIRVSRCLQTVTVASRNVPDQSILSRILSLANSSIQVIRSRTQKIVLLSYDCLAALMEDGPRPTFELHVRSLSLSNNNPGTISDSVTSWHLQYRLRDQRLLVTSPQGKSFGCVISSATSNQQPVSASSNNTTIVQSLSKSLSVACRASDLPPHILALYSIAIRLLARCIAIDAQGAIDSNEQINALKSASALLRIGSDTANDDVIQEAPSFASWSKMSQVSSASQMAQRVDESMKRRGEVTMNSSNKVPLETLVQESNIKLNASFSTTSSSSSALSIFSTRSRRSEAMVEAAVKNGEDPFPVVVKEPNVKWIDLATAKMLLKIEREENDTAAKTTQKSIVECNSSNNNNNTSNTAHTIQHQNVSNIAQTRKQGQALVTSSSTVNQPTVSTVTQSDDGGLRVTFSDKITLFISPDGRDVSINEDGHEMLNAQSNGCNESLVSTGSLTGSSNLRLPRHIKTRLLLARDYLRSEAIATA